MSNNFLKRVYGLKDITEELNNILQMDGDLPVLFLSCVSDLTSSKGMVFLGSKTKSLSRFKISVTEKKGRLKKLSLDPHSHFPFKSSRLYKVLTELDHTTTDQSRLIVSTRENFKRMNLSIGHIGTFNVKDSGVKGCVLCCTDMYGIKDVEENIEGWMNEYLRKVF